MAVRLDRNGRSPTAADVRAREHLRHYHKYNDATQDELDAWKVLQLMTKLVTWALKKTLSESGMEPRIAGRKAWRLAETMVEEQGQWVLEALKGVDKSEI